MLHCQVYPCELHNLGTTTASDVYPRGNYPLLSCSVSVTSWNTPPPPHTHTHTQRWLGLKIIALVLDKFFWKPTCLNRPNSASKPSRIHAPLLYSNHPLYVYNIMPFWPIFTISSCYMVHTSYNQDIQCPTTACTTTLKTLGYSGYLCVAPMSAVKDSPWKTTALVINLYPSQHPSKIITTCGLSQFSHLRRSWLQSTSASVLDKYVD